VEVNRPEAARYGLTVGDVQQKTGANFERCVKAWQKMSSFTIES
jgi:hypothetical protein